MGIITTLKPVNIKGIGSISAGVKISFKANFMERNQGLVAHSVWYKDQTNYDSGTEIGAEIDGLSGGKDNIFISMAEFSESELAILAQATNIIQSKVLAAIETRMDDSELLEIQ